MENFGCDAGGGFSPDQHTEAHLHFTAEAKTKGAVQRISEQQTRWKTDRCLVKDTDE